MVNQQKNNKNQYFINYLCYDENKYILTVVKKLK